MVLVLQTSAGQIDIEALPQMANTAGLAQQLAALGAYTGMHFDYIGENYILVRARETVTSSPQVPKYQSETHSRVGFSKRGTIALCPDYSLLITTRPEAPQLECSILGLIPPEAYARVIPSIADARVKEDGCTPLYPVTVEAGPQDAIESVSRSDSSGNQGPTPSSRPKRRKLAVFDELGEQGPAHTVLKRNPQFGEDEMFTRLKEFELRVYGETA